MSASNPHEDSLLRDLMNLAPSLTLTANRVLSPIADTRAQLRQRLLDRDLILKVDMNPNLISPPVTMCAVDGARVTERMYGADLLVAVATSADALYSQQAGETVSRVWADVAPHSTELDRVVGSAMAALELTVATTVDYEIRLLDGGYITSILEFMKGLGSGTTDVRNRVNRIINTYHVADLLSTILTPVPGRPVLALPKSESTNLYGKMFEEMFEIEIGVTDRILAAQILDAGEILRPRPLHEWRNVNVRANSNASKPQEASAAAITAAIEPFKQAVENRTALTCYFKQTNNANVLRFEYQSETPDDTELALHYARLLSHETNAPHMLEPTAQWAVDQKAKNISVGTKALRAAMLNNLTPEQAQTWGRYIAENYRT